MAGSSETNKVMFIFFKYNAAVILPRSIFFFDQGA